MVPRRGLLGALWREIGRSGNGFLLLRGRCGGVGRSAQLNANELGTLASPSTTNKQMIRVGWQFQAGVESVG